MRFLSCLIFLGMVLTNAYGQITADEDAPAETSSNQESDDVQPGDFDELFQGSSEQKKETSAPKVAKPRPAAPKPEKAQAVEPPPSQTQVPETTNVASVEATPSGPITLEGSEFTMIPPVGWTFKKGEGNLLGIFEGPFTEGKDIYRKNLQIQMWQGSLELDEANIKAFENKLVQAFSHHPPSIEQYAVRNHEPVTLADGRKGVLLYSDMIIEQVKIMQAHVLISSNTHHYAVSFTDVAETFEKTGTEWTIAWDAIMSTRLNSPGPGSGDNTSAILYLGILVGLVGILALLVWYKNRRAVKYFNEFDKDDGEVTSGLSKMPSAHSSDMAGSSIESAGVSQLSRPPSWHLSSLDKKKNKN